MTGRRPLGAIFFLFVLAMVGVHGRPATSEPPIQASAVRTPARAAVPAVCATPARRGFVPTVSTVKRRTVAVLALGRSRGGIPLAPPLTSSGKRSFAWDKYGPKPGSRRGNVRFNAHTYPDGSALGNWMLARLKVGNRIVVYGKSSAICYKVTKRISVTPRSWAARVGYYSTTRRPRLAIVVCSGTRLGPGNWTRRTIWYAKPSTS
jgi:hypothetical protein